MKSMAEGYRRHCCSETPLSLLSPLSLLYPLPVPLTTYSSACIGKSLLARDVYEFRVTKPAGFTFIPGQFILFSVGLVERPDDIQTRAFSIASSPTEPDLLFVAKMIPGGRASRWIEEVLAPGTPVSFTGPFGRFVVDPSTEKDYLFVATSTGVAPFRPMILSLPSRRIDLVFGVKSEEDLFWQGELEALSKHQGNFFLHIALSQSSPQWTGHRGRVQPLVPQVVANDFSHKSLYVCGSPSMTADVKQLALGPWGMDKKDVHVEGYI